MRQRRGGSTAVDSDKRGVEVTRQSQDSLNQDLADLNGPASIQTDCFVLAPKPPRRKTLREASEHIHVITNTLESHPRGKATIKRAFRSAKWQSEKNHLINSMAERTRTHRTLISQPPPATNRHTRNLSERHQSKHLLQQKLKNEYGIKEAGDFAAPPEMQTFLSEVPTLLQDKER